MVGVSECVCMCSKHPNAVDICCVCCCSTLLEELGHHRRDLSLEFLLLLEDLSLGGLVVFFEPLEAFGNGFFDCVGVELGCHDWVGERLLDLVGVLFELFLGSKKETIPGSRSA